MESAKNKYQIEDYSVGQTTLEQVSIISLEIIGFICWFLLTVSIFILKVFLNFAKSQVGEDVIGRSRINFCHLIQSLCRTSCSSPAYTCEWLFYFLIFKFEKKLSFF